MSTEDDTDTETGSGGPVGGESPFEFEATEEALDAIASTVQPPGPEHTRDRFEQNIKSVFDTREGTQWDKLLNVLTHEFEDFNSERRDVLLANYIDTAGGVYLDRLGETVLLTRRTGETDAHYRARLKTQLRVLIGGGRLIDIKEATATLIQTDPDRIRIEESYSVEPARYELYVPERPLDASGITVEELIALVNNITAAGVRPTAYKTGMYMPRSIEDFEDGVNDPDRGHGGLDESGQPRDDIGGGYTSIIIV